MVCVEAAHHPLEDANELTVRRAKLAADPAQCRRRFVAHEPVLADRALDLLLIAPRDDHSLDERREDGAQDRRTTLVAQRLARAPRGAQQHGGSEQLV